MGRLVKSEEMLILVEKNVTINISGITYFIGSS